MDALAKYITLSECIPSGNFTQWAPIFEHDIYIQMKDNKDDGSWGLSDIHNESTVDRLRTPVQQLIKSPSLDVLGEDINNFVLNSERSNEIISKNEEKNLKSDIWAQVLLLTKRKQDDIKKSKCNVFGREALQTSWANMPEKIENDIKSNSDGPVSSKSLNIIRTKTSLKYMKASKSQECALSTFAIDSDSNNSPKSLKPIFYIVRERKSNTKSKKCKSNSLASISTSKWSESDVLRKYTIMKRDGYKEAVLSIQ